MAGPDNAALPAACLNCGEPFADRAPRAPARFCPMCGQEARLKPPTLREFAQQFGGAYFSTEGALWRTLRLLLFKPGELTVQYLAGRRKHYVLPLRLYLTISVITLLLMRTLGAGVIQVNATDTPKPGVKKPNLQIMAFGDGTGAGLRDGVFYCKNLPEWVCKRLQRRIDIDPKAVGGELERFKDRFLGNLGGVMFVLLPSFALWLKLVYWNRRMRYTEHLVFALHVHAFWFVALAFTLRDSLWLSIPAFTAVPWYTMLAMRRVYGGRRGPRILRAMTVSMLYGLEMGLTLAFLAIYTLLV